MFVRTSFDCKCLKRFPIDKDMSLYKKAFLFKPVGHSVSPTVLNLDSSVRHYHALYVSMRELMQILTAYLSFSLPKFLH